MEKRAYFGIIDNVKMWKQVLTDKNVLIPTGVTLLLFIVLVSYKEKAGEKNERKEKKKKIENGDSDDGKSESEENK